MLNRALPFLAATATVLFAQNAAAGILKDHVSNASNWNGVGGANNFYDALAVRTNTVSTFVGDGGTISRVGLVFGVADGSGVANGAEPNGLDWYVTFYSSLGAFVANPFSVNDALPETVFFDTPSNANWLTIVGTSPTFELRYAEFDVTSENWTTTSGAIQGISVLPAGGTSPVIPGIQTIFALSNGIGAVGTEEDWYEAWHVPSSTVLYGPGPLSGLFSEPFAAFTIETVPVPEPSTGALAICAASLLAFAFRRRFLQLPRLNR